MLIFFRFLNVKRGMVTACSQLFTPLLSLRPLFEFKIKRLIRMLETVYFAGVTLRLYKKLVIRLLVSLNETLFQPCNGLISKQMRPGCSRNAIPFDLFHYQIVSTEVIFQNALKIDMRVIFYFLRTSQWDNWNRRFSFSAFFFSMNSISSFWEFYNGFFLMLNFS